MTEMKMVWIIIKVSCISTNINRKIWRSLHDRNENRMNNELMINDSCISTNINHKIWRLLQKQWVVTSKQIIFRQQEMQPLGPRIALRDNFDIPCVYYYLLLIATVHVSWVPSDAAISSSLLIHHGFLNPKIERICYASHSPHMIENVQLLKCPHVQLIKKDLHTTTCNPEIINGQAAAG